MSRSYRNRGYDVRVDKKSITIIELERISAPEVLWKNRALVKTHMNRILDISAKKSNPNLPELYSILKPDTNSLSPSAKSKGARLVSDNTVITHINNKGKFSTAKGNLSEDLIK